MPPRVRGASPFDDPLRQGVERQPVPLLDGTKVQLTVTPVAVEDDYDPLDEVIGICTEGPDISLAERHDEIIYGGLIRKEPKQP